MLIYSSYQNERFRFAAEMVLFRYVGAIEYTSEIERFQSHQGPKIAYGVERENMADTLCIPLTSWMWDHQVHAKLPRVRLDGQITRLYFTENAEFDVFAAVFWMLSRYEEYIALKHDHHGRFMSASSVLGWDQDTQIPWVDIWRNEFTEILLHKFPDVKIQGITFSMKMTVDVDSAFAYRHKGFLRTSGAMVKDVVRGKFGNLFRRMNCVLLGKHDPYDTYDKIAEACDKAGISLLWFFLLADRTKEDIGLSFENKQLRKLIELLNKKYEIGIHPGYASNESEDKLKEEIARLKEILGKSVGMSRQHYLKIQLPQTFRLLLSHEILHDYTLGFAENTGFRAGTNYPFPWFDLRENQRTALMLHPFVVMDTTLRNYLGLTPDEAIQQIETMIQNCKATGGEFHFLWHNESLSEIGKWRGWSRVFHAVMEMNQS